MTKPVRTKSGAAHRILPALTMLALFSVAGWAQANSAPFPPSPRAAVPGKRAGEKAVHSDGTYVIGADDVLAINVWKEPEVSRLVPVRSDGKISLPLVGELTAGGQTPLQLEEAITQRLQNYISEPDVTVIVQDNKSQRINILGMVVRPGSYQLTGSATVLDAIAMAGGFKDFAKQKSIYVLRTDASGAEKRMPFNYKDVIKGKNTQQNIRLEPRDTVVVP
jgi:polysaccharide export outer membrane protein